jgi:5-formyltetrahydrofolate cyclo-ligase
MTKQEARKVFKQNRAQLSRKDLVKMNDLLLIQFQRLVLPYLNVIHSYVPLQDQKEPDPILMIDFLKFKNVNMKVVYPKINPENFSMQSILEDDNTSFELNKYGIPEPSSGIVIGEKEIDLAFVPLIAFDLFGNRVGYGKGYYDRFISKCRFNMIKIGISYFPPLDQIEDIEEFDKKLDFCITPDYIYAF